jgi:hypothetical protein
MDWREAPLGAHVNPGWEPLVDELHAKVLEIDPDVRVDQVKEKLGGFRYYFFSDEQAAVQDLVDEYARRSLSTCEVCGETEGTISDSFGQPWINALCPRHAQIRRLTGKPVWMIANEFRGGG